MWDIREKTDCSGPGPAAVIVLISTRILHAMHIPPMPKSFATLDQIRSPVEITSLSVYPGYTSIFIKPISTSAHLKYKNENYISSNKVRTMAAVVSLSLTPSKWWGRESSGTREIGSSPGGRRDSSSSRRIISTVSRRTAQNYQKWASFCLRQAFPYKTSPAQWSHSLLLFPVEADQHRRSLAAGQEGLPHHLYQPEDGRQDVLEAPGGNQRLVLPPPELRLREQAEAEVLGERSNTGWWRRTW